MIPLSIGFLFKTSRVATGLIRLGGSFLAVVGVQYLGTAIGDTARANSMISGRRHWLLHFSNFYTSTIVSRLFLVVFIILLVCRRDLEMTWMLFAGLNGIGAFSMLGAVLYNADKDRSQ